MDNSTASPVPDLHPSVSRKIKKIIHQWRRSDSNDEVPNEKLYDGFMKDLNAGRLPRFKK